MRRLIYSLLLLFILVLPAPVTAQADQTNTAGMEWRVFEVNKVKYVALNDVCRFYRFAPQSAARKGFLSFGAGNRTISVKPGRQDFYVNKYRYILSYPVVNHKGLNLISTTDMTKLVDPILRPRLSNADRVTTVVLDPGHGGHDAGAVSAYAREKDCNLQLARKVKERLERAGLRVVMTRDGDYFLTLGQRVKIANAHPNSVFVSIHHNSGRRSAEGIETFTLAPYGTTSPFARSRRFQDLAGNDQDSENITLATAIHSRAIHSTKATDRGIQRARFSVLCTIKRPAVLFEGGFVSNPKEGARISSSAYQNLLADSIANGILSYKGLVEAKPGPVLKQRRTGTTIRQYNSYSGTSGRSYR